MNITVQPQQHGERIDIFLTAAEGIPTRSMAQKLLADENVTCNGKIIQKNYKVATGDVITFNIPEPQLSDAIAQEIPLDIVFEDNHLLVINKPQGIVVHPGAGNWQGTLVNALMHHCHGKLSGIGGVLRPGIVHRLDKDTSGLMVVAKNDIAHHGLAEQIASRNMARIYNALCFGTLAQDKIKIDVPIGRHPVSRTKMTVVTDPRHKARAATTYVETLERLGKYTLVSARLETGRTHQIRVHMAHIGHPVVGDMVYGRSNPPFAQQGQVLHAMQLSFVHPVTAQEMDFIAPWPEYFANAVKILREAL